MQLTDIAAFSIKSQTECNTTLARIREWLAAILAEIEFARIRFAACRAALDVRAQSPFSDVIALPQCAY